MNERQPVELSDEQSQRTSTKVLTTQLYDGSYYYETDAENVISVRKKHREPIVHDEDISLEEDSDNYSADPNDDTGQPTRLKTVDNNHHNDHNDMLMARSSTPPLSWTGQPH